MSYLSLFPYRCVVSSLVSFIMAPILCSLHMLFAGKWDTQVCLWILRKSIVSPILKHIILLFCSVLSAWTQLWYRHYYRQNLIYATKHWMMERNECPEESIPSLQSTDQLQSPLTPRTNFISGQTIAEGVGFPFSTLPAVPKHTG
jgi:hypothetical protein